MNNYDFSMNWYNGLTEENFLTAMRNNDASNIFNYNFKYKDCRCILKEYRAIAILENGYVDIEANFFIDEDSKPVIDFFICCKHGERDIDWDSDFFYGDIVHDYTVLTDFTKDDWEEQLEKEMFDKLDKYCKVKNYDYTKPIKY